jgi:hypothetical protein
MIWSWSPARLLFSLTDNNNGLAGASIAQQHTTNADRQLWGRMVRDARKSALLTMRI